MLWGGTLNFSITEFTKGLGILNMVMTFVLIPQSHYNTITKPRAHFLLSLMEGLSIDFSITHDRVYYRLLLRHGYT